MRRAALGATLALVTLLLAGCMGPGDPATHPAHLDDEPATPDTRTLAAFNTIVDPDGRGNEPSLGVTPDGTLFTYGWVASDAPTRAHALPYDAAIYRSRDDGRTWNRVATPTRPQPDMDPHLAVDRDGTVWFNHLTPGCNVVAVSEDQGETWWRHPAACQGPSYDRPRIVPTHGGTAYLYHQNLPDAATVLKTTDHGRTWTPTGPLAGADTERPGWAGSGFWNPATDSVYFTFRLSRGPPTPLLGTLEHAPGYAVTRNGGLSFDVDAIPGISWVQGRDDDVAKVVTGAADAQGNVYLAWVGRADGAVHVFLAASEDDAHTWTDPLRVTTGPGTRIFPTLATGSGGELAIAYYETSATAPNPGEVAQNATWNVTLSWTRNALAPAPAFEHGHLSLGPHHAGPVCTAGASCDAHRELLDFFDLQALPDGRVGSVWASTLASPHEHTVHVYGVTADPIFG